MAAETFIRKVNIKWLDWSKIVVLSTNHHINPRIKHWFNYET